MIPLSREIRMNEIIYTISMCELCRLSETRQNTVPGDGVLTSKIVLIGEAPGNKEDEHGKPFVGSAGKLLNSSLDYIGLSRSNVYITNIVKCRPPRNRRPHKSEITTCSKYLDSQLEIISPKILAPMGNSALRHIFNRFDLGRSVIGEVHGKSFSVDFSWGSGIVFPLYHPAAILYNRALEYTFRNDLLYMLKLL
jgi:DNA polymerase